MPDFANRQLIEFGPFRFLVSARPVGRALVLRPILWLAKRWPFSRGSNLALDVVIDCIGQVPDYSKALVQFWRPRDERWVDRGVVISDVPTRRLGLRSGDIRVMEPGDYRFRVIIMVGDEDAAPGSDATICNFPSTDWDRAFVSVVSGLCVGIPVGIIMFVIGKVF